MPSEPWEAAEWEFLWVGLLSCILWAWQGSQAEGVCNQLLWKQAWDHQSAWAQRFPSFPSLPSSLPPFSLLQRKPHSCPWKFWFLFIWPHSWETHPLLWESAHVCMWGWSTPWAELCTPHVCRCMHTGGAGRVQARTQTDNYQKKLLHNHRLSILCTQASLLVKIMRNYHGNPWTSLSSLLIPQNTAWQLQLHLPEHTLFESTGQKIEGLFSCHLLGLISGHVQNLLQPRSHFWILLRLWSPENQSQCHSTENCFQGDYREKYFKNSQIHRGGAEVLE